MGTCFFPNFYPVSPLRVTSPRPDTFPLILRYAYSNFYTPDSHCVRVCEQWARVFFLFFFIRRNRYWTRRTNNGRNFYKKTTPYCEREKKTLNTVRHRRRSLRRCTHFLGTKTVFFSKKHKNPLDISSFPGWLLTVFFLVRSITVLATHFVSTAFFFFFFKCHFLWIFWIYLFSFFFQLCCYNNAFRDLLYPNIVKPSFYFFIFLRFFFFCNEFSYRVSTICFFFR